MDALDRALIGLFPDWPPLEADKRSVVVANCLIGVRLQIRRAPAHVRFGLWMLLSLVRSMVVARQMITLSRIRGHSPGNLSSIQFELAFTLERALRSIVLLNFFEHPHVLAALKEDSIADRQRAFRLTRESMLNSSQESKSKRRRSSSESIDWNQSTLTDQ